MFASPALPDKQRKDGEMKNLNCHLKNTIIIWME